jgi:hypothetical protein
MQLSHPTSVCVNSLLRSFYTNTGFVSCRILDQSQKLDLSYFLSHLQHEKNTVRVNRP